jgi:hypothetical protein
VTSFLWQVKIYWIGTQNAELTSGEGPEGEYDTFYHLVTSLKAETACQDIKVIAYMASEGPAKLKHGAEKAFDAEEVGVGVWQSASMDRWDAHVEEVYGSPLSDKSRKNAYADIIVAYYAERFAGLVDGYW